MLDSIGVPVELGDWVAFYRNGKGKMLFGKVVSFSASTILVQPNGKKLTVRRTSQQVVKVSADMIDTGKVIVKDALGVELNVGDWVATNTLDRNSWSSNGEFTGKMAFGEIKEVKKTTVKVMFPSRKNPTMKMPNQVVKVSQEQVTLRYFAQ